MQTKMLGTSKHCPMTLTLLLAAVLQDMSWGMLGSIRVKPYALISSVRTPAHLLHVSPVCQPQRVQGHLCSFHLGQPTFEPMCIPTLGNSQITCSHKTMPIRYASSKQNFRKTLLLEVLSYPSLCRTYCTPNGSFLLLHKAEVREANVSHVPAIVTHFLVRWSNGNHWLHHCLGGPKKPSRTPTFTPVSPRQDLQLRIPTIHHLPVSPSL